MSTYNPDQEDLYFYSLVELLETSRLQEPFIVACVETGVIELQEAEPQQWRFNIEMCQQLQKAWRLHHELEVQIASLPLVLDLLGELDLLRHEVQFLKQRLRHWEPDN